MPQVPLDQLVVLDHRVLQEALQAQLVLQAPQVLAVLVAQLDSQVVQEVQDLQVVQVVLQVLLALVLLGQQASLGLLDLQVPPV